MAKCSIRCRWGRAEAPRARGVCGALVAVIALIGSAADSQARPLPVDVNRYGEAGLLDAPRAAVIGTGRYAFGAWGNYVFDEGHSAVRVSPISMGIGLPWRLDAALALISSASVDPNTRNGPVQLQLGLKHLIVQQSRFPVDVAVALRLENMLSPPDMTPWLLVDRAFDGAVVTAGVGYRFATAADGERALLYAAGAQMRVTRRLTAEAETLGSYGVDSGFGASWAGAIRIKVYETLGVVVGLSGGIGSAAAVRATVGLRFRPAGTGFEDSDGDGVLDRSDRCPNEPEDRDGFQDDDGCPEVGAPARPGPQRRRGPARMRLKIPQQPIPVWVCDPDNSTNGTSNSTAGVRQGESAR